MKKLIIAFITIVLLAGIGTAKADTEYFRELAERKIAYLSDACYTACLLLGVSDEYKDFLSQRRYLRKSGILPARLSKAEGDLLLRKGVTAYIFCNALEIKGGAMMRVFGTSERYALRELVYKEIITEGPEQTIVSGGELLSILMRASEYKNNAK